MEPQRDHRRTSVAAPPAWHLAAEHIDRDDGYRGAKRLTEAPLPTRRGNPRWPGAAVRGLRCLPVSMGMAYRGRTRPAPAGTRRSVWRPVGTGQLRRPALAEDWLAIPGPAIVREEPFAAAQARLARHTQRARRNHTAHASLRRGGVSWGPWQLSGLGCTHPPGYPYDLGRGRTDA